MQTMLIATVQGGKPKLSEGQRNKLNNAFRAREGRLVRIAIGDMDKSRSNQQNKYYWGCVLKLVAEYTGYTENEVHEWLKDQLLPKKFVTIAGVEVEARKSTSDLSTVDFQAYIEHVRAFAAMELQIVIPLPSEI